MARQTVNGAFTLEIPEGFQAISRSELEQAGGGGEDRWGVRDPQQHRVILIAWKKYPALLSILADLKTMAKRNEQILSRKYAGAGYQARGFFSGDAGEIRMEGYRFTYQQGDVRNAAENSLLKCGKLFYSITCIGREENTEKDREVFRKVLESLETL